MSLEATAKRLNTEVLAPGTIDPKIAEKGRKAVEKKAQALGRLKIEYVAVNTIWPNPYNPNRQTPHDFELLLRSMKEDGFTQPVVTVRVTEEKLSDPVFKDRKVGDIVIVDGEHRWRAAQHIGLTEVPIVITDMTPEQMRISTLRHNRARGSEDIELAAQVLRDLRELGALDYAQDSLMLDDTELEKLLEDVPAPEALAAEEYSQAWEPDKSSGGGKVGTVDAGHFVDGTPEALLKAREQEARIASAKTDEEKKAAVKDSNVFRLALMFTGEEAVIVKAALGPKPALQVLEWCKAASVKQ